MIRVEYIINNRLKKTYSDLHVLIHKIGTGENYTAAIDLPTANWQYEETDIQIIDEII